MQLRAEKSKDEKYVKKIADNMNTAVSLARTALSAANIASKIVGPTLITAVSRYMLVS